MKEYVNLLTVAGEASTAELNRLSEEGWTVEKTDAVPTVSSGRFPGYIYLSVVAWREAQTCHACGAMLLGGRRNQLFCCGNCREAHQSCLELDRRETLEAVELVSRQTYREECVVSRCDGHAEVGFYCDNHEAAAAANWRSRFCCAPSCSQPSVAGEVWCEEHLGPHRELCARIERSDRFDPFADEADLCDAGVGR